MRAYYFDNLPGDQRLPHNSSLPVSTELLKTLGVLYWHIPIDSEGHWQQRVNEIADERHYRNRDVVTATKEAIGEKFDDMMKMFFREHLHEDEEIRYVEEGSSYFDIREHTTDEWIRVHLVAGDMIILPAGIYHRFTLDSGDSARLLRLFKDEPKWAAHNRCAETDVNPHRLKYIRQFPGVAIGA